jgi:hypothetical protein
MLKQQKKEKIPLKKGILLELGGYPNPYVILGQILQPIQWFTNKELAETAHVTQNDITRIKKLNVGDMRVSVLAKILTALTPNIRREFFYQWEKLLSDLDDVLEADPDCAEELLGEKTNISDNLFQDF